MSNRFDDLFADADAAFNGAYKDELAKLTGLSESEVAAIAPGTTGTETYESLINTVKTASQDNLSQAELKSRIEELGNVAISIAKKVPQLAALF